MTSQFDKNDRSAAALTARNAVLNKEIDQQKEKISTLRSALDNATTSFGETDRRTQNWQIVLNKAEAELNGMERELGANNNRFFKTVITSIWWRRDSLISSAGSVARRRSIWMCWISKSNRTKSNLLMFPRRWSSPKRSLVNWKNKRRKKRSGLINWTSKYRCKDIRFLKSLMRFL